MDAFYVGLHQPSDAQHFDRCCIHVDRLATRQKSLGCRELLFDSRAFKILELYGEHRLTPEQYATAAERVQQLCEVVTPVTQDYMCEKYIFQKRHEHTGRWYTVADHQRLTIERYDAIRAALDKGIYLMPVLQGYQPHEYADHVRQYGRRLASGAWVGVGSVCKRNGDPSAIRDVLYAIRGVRSDLRLHGFGIKQTALSWHGGVIRDWFYSADSMAWSYAARRRDPRRANDWNEAEAYRKRLDGALDDLPMFNQERLCTPVY